MRRCKHFIETTLIYRILVDCDKKLLGRNWDGTGELGCNKGVYPCYEPVEIDPYWKDIFDETNRRLNEQQGN